MKVTLVPIDVSTDVTRQASQTLKDVYQSEVRVLDTLEIPISAVDIRSNEDDDVQLYAEDILTYMLKQINPNHSLILLLTDQDLYYSDRRFIFGCSRFNGTIGIVSTYRLQSDEEDTYRSRINKQVIKQVGRMLGLGKCDHVRCVLSFAAVCDDLDATTEAFCSECYDALASSG